MKKTLLTILGLAALSLTGTQAANTIWDYNFGTETGVYSTANSSSTTFLPAPESNGGTARVRVGSGGGSFNLENPGSSLGSGSELRIVAPTGGSVNKFSIYDYGDASTAFTLSFDLLLSGGSSGTFYLITGNGASFSDSNAFTGAQTFTGIRWVFEASDTITTNVRSGGSWVTTGLPETPFAQNINYSVQIVGNNGASSITYGDDNTLDAGKWDLWIGGVKAGTISAAQLPSSTVIDSFMFYGESSAGNVANLTLDNISYANYAIPEPATALLVGLGAASLILRRRMARK